MDHVVPIGRGGKSTKGNVVISCKDCNNAKKDRLLMDWSSYRQDGELDLASSHEPRDQKEHDE